MAKVRKAVITAAGKGTRQYPASTAVQKEMFPMVDRDGLTKPVIQIIGEEAIDSGIEEICIITQPGEESLYRDYFKRLDDDMVKAFRGKDWAILESEKLGAFGERLHFAEQHSPEGFGHAVYQAKNFVGDEPFLLLLGDHVYISDIKDRCARQLIKVYEQYMLDAVTGVQPTVERQLHLFGTIRGNPIDPAKGIFKAELIIEKPSIEEAREKLATPGLPGTPAASDRKILGRHHPGPALRHRHPLRPHGNPARPRPQWRPPHRNLRGHRPHPGDAGQELTRTGVPLRQLGPLKREVSSAISHSASEVGELP
jgi:UTP--glucose-1-phosphate uridylyltransferase